MLIAQLVISLNTTTATWRIHNSMGTNAREMLVRYFGILPVSPNTHSHLGWCADLGSVFEVTFVLLRAQHHRSFCFEFVLSQWFSHWRQINAHCWYYFVNIGEQMLASFFSPNEFMENVVSKISTFWGNDSIWIWLEFVWVLCIE